MKKTLPPLVALRAFDAVGRLKSIRAAGEELSVNSTVISRHVQNLEAVLGVKLIETRGRGIVLTELGEAYHRRVSRPLSDIAAATQEINPAYEIRKTLVIWCGPGLVSLRLLARLPELEARLPKFQIVIVPALTRPDLEAGEADVEIFYLEEPEEMMLDQHAIPLASPLVLPVASPDLRNRFPLPEHPADYLKMPLIHERSTRQWIRWLARFGVDTLPDPNGRHLWHANLTIQAAQLGYGVALANDVLVEDYLRKGTLVLMGNHHVCLGSYYLVTRPGRDKEPAIRAILEWATAATNRPAGFAMG